MLAFPAKTDVSGVSAGAGYGTAYRFVTYGESEFVDHRKDKLLILWAFTVTFLGSVAAAALEQFETDLKRRSQQLAQGHRDLRVECLTSYSDLLQASMAWVAGSAWTDVVTALCTSLRQVPSLPVLLSNAAVSVAVAALAVGWLVLTGDTQASIDDTSREVVERYFVTTSLAFFVGWVWLVWHRNAIGLVIVALEELATERGWDNLDGRVDVLGMVGWVALVSVVMLWLQTHGTAPIAYTFDLQQQSPAGEDAAAGAATASSSACGRVSVVAASSSTATATGKARIELV